MDTVTLNLAAFASTMEKLALSSVLDELAKLPELGNYIIEEKLGEGTFAVVVRARHKRTNELVLLSAFVML